MEAKADIQGQKRWEGNAYRVFLQWECLRIHVAKSNLNKSARTRVAMGCEVSDDVVYQTQRSR